MKKILMALTVAACVMFVTPCYGKNCGVVKSEESKIDTLSYALGANMGTGIKQQFADIALNIDVVIKGIDDALNGKMSKSHDEVVAMLREFFGQTLSERSEAYKKELEKNANAVFNAFADAAECDKISYAFGSDIGCNVKKSNLPIHCNWILEGLKEAWNGNSKLSPEEVTAYLNHYFTVVRPAEMAQRSAAWLAEKEKEEGVRKTESGLLYKVVVVGDMSKAAKSDEDVVKVHYIGRLQDGTVFDSSRFEYRSKEQQETMRKQNPELFDANGVILKNDPIEFPLNRVIKGWTEGMKLIGPGGKIVLYIPAELAYGSAGAGNVVGPNEALEFEIELIEVTPAAK